MDKTRLGDALKAKPTQGTVLLAALLTLSVAQADDSTQLKPITVEQQSEPVTESPMGIGISGDTLSTAPGSGGDPLRGLQAVPGMVFNDDESAEPAVRGTRPGDNYFQTDFSPASYLFHFGGAISVYHADLIESFSIYPSAYGPEFSGVTGGVFDVALRDPKIDRFHTTLDISFLQAGFLVEGPVNDSQSFYLAGRRSYLDLFIEDQIDEPDISFTDFPNYTDYQAKYVWAFNPDSTLRLSATGATDDADLTLSDDAEEVATDPVFGGRIYDATRFNGQSVVWDTNLSERLSVKSTIHHNRFSNDAIIGTAGAIDVDENTWLVKSHATLQVNDKHVLKLGAEYSNTDTSFDIDFNAPTCTDFEPDCLYTGAERLRVTEKANINTLKVFAKDTWYVNDQLTVIPGVAVQREDYLDNSFVEPRLALEYAIADDLLLTAGMGVYHQMPDIDQVNDVFGNPKLKFLSARHTSIGLQKQWPGGWSIATELYHNRLTNLVTSDDELRYSNNGEGTATGIDTLIRKQLTDKLSGWLSVSVSDATRTDNRTGREFDFEYDQPVNASLVASYKFSPRWSVGAKLWAHSGAPYTPVTGATPDTEVEGLYRPQYAELNSARLPSFSRLDIRIDRTFRHKKKHRKTQAYVELLNVLDNDNISGYSYNADYSVRTPEEQIPRFVSLGIKTSF